MAAEAATDEPTPGADEAAAEPDLAIEDDGGAAVVLAVDEAPSGVLGVEQAAASGVRISRPALPSPNCSS